MIANVQSQSEHLEFSQRLGVAAFVQVPSIALIPRLHEFAPKTGSSGFSVSGACCV
jgi:hypothetical protein